MTDTPKDAATKGRSQGTFVVLTPAPSPTPDDGENADTRKHYVEVDRVQANGSMQAIKTVASDEDNGDGTYIAVPERSFQPRKVTTKTAIKTSVE